MHYYKRNLGDYAKKAGRLSMLEHGAYTLLLDACYDRERFPTEAEAIEWAWARTESEIAAVRFVLSRFFTLTDGVYVQERIAEEVATYQRNAENNARIAKEREENRRKNARTVHEACVSGDEAPPNHKPLTKNKEPRTKDVKPARASRKQAAADAAPPLTLSDLISEGVKEQHARDWLKVRDKQRAPLTQTAWDLHKSECIKAGITPGQGVQVCAAASWRGFDHTWNWRKFLPDVTPTTTAPATSKFGGCDAVEPA